MRGQDHSAEPELLSLVPGTEAAVQSLGISWAKSFKPALLRPSRVGRCSEVSEEARWFMESVSVPNHAAVCFVPLMSAKLKR